MVIFDDVADVFSMLIVGYRSDFLGKEKTETVYKGKIVLYSVLLHSFIVVLLYFANYYYSSHFLNISNMNSLESLRY